VVGYSFLDYTTHAQNSEQVEYFGMVHPELRRKGIATALYVEMEKYGLELGKTKPEMWFSPEESPGNADFAKKLGYSPATEEKVSRLHKENISWDYVNSREEQYRDLESRYQLLFLSRKEWADLILADQEMAAERILKTPHQDGQNVYAIEPETRRIVAMSGTFFANDPPIRDIGTGLTAVRKAYQRQGLATYLKIKVLRHFIQTLPQFEFIFTENAASNQGMLSINYNLGFRTEFSWEGWQKKYEE
jgi:GNAT superfamily N-acetyltransferase